MYQLEPATNLFHSGTFLREYVSSLSRERQATLIDQCKSCAGQKMDLFSNKLRTLLCRIDLFLRGWERRGSQSSRRNRQLKCWKVRFNFNYYFKQTLKSFSFSALALLYAEMLCPEKIVDHSFKDRNLYLRVQRFSQIARIVNSVLASAKLKAAYVKKVIEMESIALETRDLSER